MSGNTNGRFDKLLKAMAEGEKPSEAKPKVEPDARTFRHKRPNQESPKAS